MIVISGASGGLGTELVKLFKADGKMVVSVSRHRSEQADKNIVCDLTKGSEITQALQEILKIKEPLEAVINCVGVFSMQKLGEITEAEIKRTMATNVKAPMLLVSGLIERIKKDGADIVNVSSSVGTKAYEDQAVYGASKWALRGFSANLQVELKGTPCRVISFLPGGFKSHLFEKATGIDNTTEGNWMSAADVAKALKFTLDVPKNMEVSEIIINRK